MNSKILKFHIRFHFMSSCIVQIMLAICDCSHWPYECESRSIELSGVPDDPFMLGVSIAWIIELTCMLAKAMLEERQGAHMSLLTFPRGWGDAKCSFHSRCRFDNHSYGIFNSHL